MLNLKEKYKHISLSVVIPVFNEEKCVVNSINSCLEQLTQVLDDFEIIVVEDGSSDNTWELLQRSFSNNSRVALLQNLINLNAGISVQRGFACAKKDFVTHNGIDLPFRFENLVHVLPLLQNFDVIVVERTEYAGYTLWRRLTSMTWRVLNKVLFRLPFRDLNFVQFYRRSYVQDVCLLSRSPAFTTPELIIRAIKSRLRITSARCKYSKREVGTYHLGKANDILWSLYDMLRFFLTVHLRKRYER